MKKRIITPEFKIGIFILCGLFIFFFFIFSQGKIFHGRWYQVNVLFSNIAGLKNGDPVRVSGYKTGDVKGISIYYGKIETTEKPEIRVTLNLSTNLKLGHHSVFTIDSTGLIGEKYVEIIPTGLNDTPLIYPGETVKGVSPVSVGEILNTGITMVKNFNTLVSSTNTMLSSKKFKSGIYSIGPDLHFFVRKTAKTLNSFNSLAISLKRNSDELQKILNQNQEDIHHIILETDKTLENTNKTIKDADTAVKDADTAVKNISLTAAKTSTHIREIKNSFVKTSDNLDTLITSLKTTSKNFTRTSEKISALSDNINETVSAINKEKGTLGKLVYDKELYNTLLEFVREIKQRPARLLFGR
ncbi:MAG: MlaD family protein [Candidatus Omnitrophica bacterium]|nr:MlaD family protein [Candidatus Omnitrophota bacterium]